MQRSATFLDVALDHASAGEVKFYVTRPEDPNMSRKAKRVQQPPQLAKNEKREPNLIPAAIILTLLVAGTAYIASRIHSSHAAGSASALEGSADKSEFGISYRHVPAND